MVAKQPEDLLLDAAVIGTAPTVLNANGANQKKFDESLLVRLKHEVATNPDELFFFGRAARDAARNVLSVSFKEKKIPRFIGLVRAATLLSFHRKNWPNFV